MPIVQLVIEIGGADVVMNDMTSLNVEEAGAGSDKKPLALRDALSAC